MDTSTSVGFANRAIRRCYAVAFTFVLLAHCFFLMPADASNAMPVAAMNYKWEAIKYRNGLIVGIGDTKLPSPIRLPDNFRPLGRSALVGIFHKSPFWIAFNVYFDTTMELQAKSLAAADYDPFIASGPPLTLRYKDGIDDPIFRLWQQDRIYRSGQMDYEVHWSGRPNLTQYTPSIDKQLLERTSPVLGQRKQIALALVEWVDAK